MSLRIGIAGLHNHYHAYPFADYGGAHLENCTDNVDDDGDLQPDDIDPDCIRRAQ